MADFDREWRDPADDSWSLDTAWKMPEFSTPGLSDRSSASRPAPTRLPEFPPSQSRWRAPAGRGMLSLGLSLIAVLIGVVTWHPWQPAVHPAPSAGVSISGGQAWKMAAMASPRPAEPVPSQPQAVVPSSTPSPAMTPSPAPPVTHPPFPVPPPVVVHLLPAQTPSPSASPSPGGAAVLTFTQRPATSTAGSPIKPAVTVQIRDAEGRPVASSATITVALGSNPAGGTLSGATRVAAVGGVATFNDLSVNRSGGGYALTVSSDTLTPATSTRFTVNPGPAANLVLTNITTSGRGPECTIHGHDVTCSVTGAGDPGSITSAVKVVDDEQNPVPVAGPPVSVQVGSEGGGLAAPASLTIPTGSSTTSASLTYSIGAMRIGGTVVVSTVIDGVTLTLTCTLTR